MLSITLRQLEYAVAVGRAQSVTLAADSLHISQPALSVALAALEAQLGKPLFLRKPGGPMATTAYGRSFLEGAERILADLGALTQGRSMRPAPVTLGCFEDLAPLILAPLMAKLARTHPAIQIIPQIGGFKALAQGLAQGTIDLAITYDLGFEAALERCEITRLQPHAVIAADHPLAARAHLTLADLADEPLTLADQDLSLGHIRALFTGRGLSPTIAHRAASLETMRSFAANGLGIGISYTRPAAQQSYDGRALVTRPITDAGIGAPIILIHNPANPLGDAALALARLIRAIPADP